MKKFLFGVWALVSMVSCSKFDDSSIWEELRSHEERILRLETLCNQMNTNLTSLQTIIIALQNNDYFTNVAPIKEGAKEIGYTITFAKSGSITIYHGQDGADGKDGKDGYTPKIGVKQHTDGNYYWTLDGNWLLDGTGNMIPTTGENGKDGANGVDGKDGQDGVTPQLKIEDGYWYLSYDNGVTWKQLGKATGNNGIDGEDGDSIIDSITQDEDNVYFNLSDGQVLMISKRTEKVIDFADFNVRIICLENWDSNDDGEISYAEAAAVTSLGSVFKNNKDIILFNELKYFTGLKEIDEDAFGWCENLRNVVLPENIQIIRDGAFQYSNLGGIVIPKSVLRIESSAFYGCERLSSLEFEANSQLLKIEGWDQYGAFAKCSIKTLRIPRSVIEIGSGAFIQNELSEVVFEEGSQLMDIVGGFYRTSSSNTNPYQPYGAFACNPTLTKIVIPASVTSVGDYMFEEIKEVYVLSEQPFEISSMTFYDRTSISNAISPISINATRLKTVKIYVPLGSEDAYKSYAGWSYYKDQIFGYDYEQNPL